MRPLVLLGLLLLAGCTSPDPAPAAEAIPPPRWGEWREIADVAASYQSGLAAFEGGVGILASHYDGATQQGSLTFLAYVGSQRTLERATNGSAFAIGSDGRDLLVFHAFSRLEIDAYQMAVGVTRVDPRTGAASEEAIDDGWRPTDPLVENVLPRERVRPPTSQASTITVGGSVYVVGGCCSVDGVWKYDLDAKTWGLIAELPRTEDGGHRLSPALAIRDGRVLIGGGEDPTVWAFDPATKEFTPVLVPRAHSVALFPQPDGRTIALSPICIEEFAAGGERTAVSYSFPRAARATPSNGPMYVLEQWNNATGADKLYAWTPPTSIVAQPATLC